MSGGELLPLKRFVDSRRPLTYGIVQAGEHDPTGVPYIRPADMTDHAGVRDATQLLRTSPDIARAYKRSELQPGDIVISIGPSYGKTMVVDETLAGANLTQGTARVAVDRQHFTPYVRWALRSSLALASWDAAVGGATFRALNLEPLSETPIPNWPLAIQRAIANYLDRETLRIDRLIAAKRDVVRLLGARWQVVMHDAAAGELALDLGARRSASVPWLTDLPSHWREARLKLVAKLGTGHTPSRSHPEWWVDLTVPWITTGEVAQMRSDQIEYINETRERISELGMANSSAVLHPAGTVVLCRTAASAGYSAIMGRDMATSQDFATWTCGPLLRPRFLLLCLRAMRQDLLGRLAMGSTHKTIYMPDIESIKVPLPPIDEQDRLVAGADSQKRTLEECASRLGSQITLLEEHRRALITAAVTGQLDLREAA